ncbi:MAG: hypothetical protein L0Y36_04435 [Planctomycetales bacterium]|nr:hypothetical protein [Planctomycetales bacterium]
MKIQNILFAAAVFVGTAGPTLLAQSEMYYYLPLRQVEIQGQWPDQGKTSAKQLEWPGRQYLKYYMPYAVSDKGEEIYLDFGGAVNAARLNRFDLWQVQSITQLLDSTHLAVKTERDVPPAGTVYLPKTDLSGMVAVKFTISKDAAGSEQEAAKRKFYTAMKNHYDFLQGNGFAGAAWFRYRAGHARQMPEKDGSIEPNEIQQGGQFTGLDPIEESMSLFTGQKAVSENIQLDRTLQTRLSEPQTIDISSIEGITTAQIDWKTLTEGVDVVKDPLARYIPADQHAVFYPTFRSMMEASDELKTSSRSLPAFGFAARNIEQYEQQMCVWLDGWSRFWGPKTIRGVAFTGSDPYWDTGTDSAVLFDAVTAWLVYSNTESKQQEALKKIKDAKKMTGAVEGIAYQAVVAPDRAVSSYLAIIDNVVVVTNSLAQLEKIAQTAKSAQKSVAALDEYAFFRSRYPMDEARQTAFLVMTDAAIRRWCSPRWRIGAARRTMIAVILSQLQAEYLDNPAEFDLRKAQKTAQNWAPDIGNISVTEAGITSSVYGNLRFMTPISELSVKKVSEQERRQYERFRESYQRQWRTFFDPVAVSMLLKPDVMDIDMTVRPLIAASEYREFMQIGGKNTLQPNDGDPHPQSILQWILAVDSDSEPLRMAGGFTRPMITGLEPNTNPLGWLGRWITVFADESPFWDELAEHLRRAAPESESFEYMEQNLNRLPLAVAMDVKSPAKLTLFLVGLRAFIEQTAPNMTIWETLTHQEQPYVKVTMRYRPNAPNPPSVYYAALPECLILTPNEDLLKQAIERSGASQAPGEKGEKPLAQWLGKNMSVQANERAWTVIEKMVAGGYSRYLQGQSWNNLPILNEWHGRKEKLSELDFHKRYWHTELTCPGGGQYVWNQEFHTFESTVFGHPAQPRLPVQIPTPLTKTKKVQFGITFEEDGLRAKTVIERQK